MSDERARRLAQLRQAYEAGILDEDTYGTAVAALDNNPTYQAQSGDGATAQGTNATAVGERGVQAGRAEVIISGDNNSVRTIIHHYGRQAPAAADPDTLRRQIGHYLTWLLDWSGTLELRGIQRQGEQVVQLPLEQVYVPLAATQYRRSSGGDAGSSRMYGESQQDVNLSDVLSLGKRLILTGGPGCGKTTVLLHVAWALAQAMAADDLHIAATKVGFPVKDKEQEPLPLPIFVPLSMYAAHRRSLSSREDRTLAAFISHYLFGRQTSFHLPEDFFRCLLREGQSVLLLLDGLDEVPDEAERAQVRQAIEDLVTGRDQMRVVVTCRTAAYQGRTALGKGFHQVTVKPLAQEHIDALIRHAYAHIYRTDPAQQRQKSDELLQGIARWEQERQMRSGKDTPRLFDSPLLVRMLLIVHYRERRLPEQRAELYMRAVDAMLLPDYNPDVETTDYLGQFIGGNWEVHRDLVQHLAFQMHRRGPEQGREIKETDLRRLLAEETAYAPLANTFIAVTRQRGTLLEERLERYRFLHLAFQEYLAARYLATIKLSEGGLQAVLSFLEEGPLLESWWREVILLIAGYFSVTSPQTAQSFLQRLAGIDAAAAERKSLPPAVQLAAAELAATAWLEWPAQRQELRRRLAARLAALLADVELMSESQASWRAAAGRALAQLGDPRPGVGVDPTTGLPDIVWGEEVPVGVYRYKETEVQIKRSYRLARYPITYAQFQCFVEAPNFDDNRWWAGMPSNARELRKQLFPFVNHPCENSWYEAVAFCRWLSDKLCYEVRLPHECEWEVAARYPDGRSYPWGNDFDAEKANTKEGKINGTTAVGIYPQGVNQGLGLYDLSGNVWEWCGNKNSDPNDDAVDSSGALRVLRGGSWDGALNAARATYRYSGAPGARHRKFGFRVMVRRRPSHSGL
jgi:hypothetical protein